MLSITAHATQGSFARAVSDTRLSPSTKFGSLSGVRLAAMSSVMVVLSEPTSFAKLSGMALGGASRHEI
jgi:hypothetical protein